MKDYWKHFANDYWTNKLCWKVQKAKNYDKKSIRQWCHLLKITKNFLSNNVPEDREKYLKFCKSKKEESFFINKTIQTQLYLTCKAVEEDAFELQRGISKKKYQKRYGIIEDFKKGFDFDQIFKKYEKNIITDLNANARNAFKWWKDWGYASIVKSKDKEYLFITEIGNDACKKYDNDGACLAIFREQIKKYQLPFSLEDDKKKIPIDTKIKPYYAIVEIILNLREKYISKNEYILFANTLQNHEKKNIKQVSEKIEKYRELDQDKQQEIFNYIKYKDPETRKSSKSGRTLSTVEENSLKSIQAFITDSGDLFHSEKEKFFIPSKNINKAKEIIEKFHAKPALQYHNFENIYEYNKAIGKRNYENIFEIVKRNYLDIGIKETNYKGLDKKDFQEIEKDWLLERHLQTYYEQNLEEIDKKLNTKLEIKERKGSTIRKTKEFDTFDVGEIDLLCRDKITNKYYVIEIKRDEADGKTLGQLLQYMGWVHKEFKEIPNGVIICRHISSQYNFAENFFSIQTKNSIRIQTIFHNFSNNNLPSVKKFDTNV